MTSIPDRSFLILFNPSAGSGRAAKLLPLVREYLEQQDAKLSIVATTSLAHACEQARKGARAGLVVVSMGGDGLLGSLAGEVAAENGVMGLLPAGRGNDFARTVGIPKDPIAACKVLFDQPERMLDMGEANGHPFMGIASAGFDSVANRFANNARLVKGSFAYAYGGIKALVSWQPATFSVTADSDHLSFSGYSVSAANSKAYGGGMILAPDADLTDGKLDLVTIGDVPKLRFLAALPKVYKGTHLKLDRVDTRRASTVEIDADRAFRVYADGEDITKLPVKIKVLAGALRMILPATAKTR